jgi:ATP-dependent RNA helicase DeaD
VTKQDIGSIKIFDRDTKFEITKSAEAKFRAALAAGTEDGVTVSDAVAPGPKEKPASRWDKKPAGDGGDRPERKPWANKSEGAPRGDKPAWKDREGGEKKPWVKRDDAPAGEKKPWVKREDGAPSGEKKPWVKRDKPAFAERSGEAPAKKPWVKKDPSAPKAAWAPASDAHPAAAPARSHGRASPRSSRKAATGPGPPRTPRASRRPRRSRTAEVCRPLIPRGRTFFATVGNKPAPSSVSSRERCEIGSCGPWTTTKARAWTGAACCDAWAGPEPPPSIR